jgi:protein involved in polysaccharide export with SLBB domain
VYYVRGEVKSPGRQIYVGQITVTKAITSAGDFDDFSNKRNVILTRANGKRFVINCDKILNGDAPDPGVYPGDQIDVQRRMF